MFTATAVLWVVAIAAACLVVLRIIAKIAAFANALLHLGFAQLFVARHIYIFRGCSIRRVREIESF